MLITFKRYQIVIGFEIFFWVIALLLLAFMKPDLDAHYSFCILKFIGFERCPGCGLGHSISYIFHGDIRRSFAAHPLGIFALIVILARIYKLACLTTSSASTKSSLCKTTKTLPV
ncbi:MAG: DUF2752 domain-containing protein [Ginsengibacter sp.]